ncbi:MAG: HAMP domain-containing histidine kinase [Bacteroidaceae bacterium]|nr:HAMP domain-containing histidine kinase [Bacteroidaceae bacterium]
MEATENKLQQQIAYLQQQLHTQEKMASLGMLSAGIAHEIQNPLNFVINFSKMSAKLLDDLTDLVDDCAEKLDKDDAEELEDIAADLKENMQKIQEHGERAISIIRGILLQSRGKAGEFLPTDVGQLVHEYVWLSYHAMRANDKSFNIAIQEDIQEGMPKVMVIPQDLSRAVLNVMNNACYTVKERAQSLGNSQTYTPTIAIKVALQQEGAEAQLHIDITDNGMGMTPDVQEKIFQLFFTTKPAGQGTGLGMSITNDIITNNHKGKLLMTSTPNVGTTFSFIIPVKIAK